MWWQWLIFGLIMILAPAGVLNLYFLASKKQDNLTEDKKKKASVRVFCLILYYWLVAFFYMVSFNHWLVWQFILGGLVLLLFFTGLANAVSSPAQKGSVITFSNLLDLAVGIGVSVYLLYIIPSKRLRNVLVPIVAAVYGGLLTLVGVAWTIRYNQMVKQKEEKEKVKPYLQLISALPLTMDKEEKYDIKVTTSFCEKGERASNPYEYLYLKNVGEILIVEAIKLNTSYKRCKKTLIAANNILLLAMQPKKFNIEDETLDIKLYGRDRIGNHYCFIIENKIVRQENTFVWKIECISMPIEIEKKEMQIIYNECETQESRYS